MDADPEQRCELEAIRQTLAAYNVFGDRLRLQELAETFMPDGVLEPPGRRLAGRDAIIKGLGGAGEAGTPGRDAKRRASFVRHNLTTSFIELTGPDTAAARSYFIVFTDIGPDRMGYYVDRLRKWQGRWRFEHRRVTLDWVSEATLMDGLEAHRARQAALAQQRGTRA